jgi:tetratricopeptide (TPR) repeat protein
MMNSNNHEENTLFNVRIDIWICLFLVVSILCVYWQVRNFSFVNFDDRQYVTGNYHIQAGFTLESIRWSFTATQASNWHPLTWLSHMLDYQIYGMNPGHHHMTNVLLHILNTLLLFFIFKRISGSRWKSAFIAALFALHPLHVESVAWVAERKDVLSTFFWMLALWSYASYVENSKLGRYLLLILFYFLGLMAKPMIVTLPFVLLLLDYWPLKRFRLWPSNNENPAVQMPFYFGLIREKIPLFLLSVASSVVTYLVQKSSGAVNSLAAIPFHVRIANALVSYVNYIGKMFWPHNLAVLYPYPKSITLWKIIGAGLLITVITVLVLRLLRSKPYLAVGWLWYLGTLVPVIGIVQVGSQALADRYTYVPLIGIFIMVTWGISDWVSKKHYKRIGFFAATAAILLLLMITSRLQVKYWTNSVTLFEHAINVTDDNDTAQLNLGEALAEQGNMNKAVKHYKAALNVNPDLAGANFNIGVYFREEGKIDEAINHFSKVLHGKSDHADAQCELGDTLKRRGDLSRAVKCYLEAIKIRPGYAKAYNNLGVIFASQNKVEAAIAFFSKALQISPGYAGAHFNLGKIYASLNDLDKAIFHFQKALQFDPNMVQALYRLSWMRATHEDKKYRNGKEAVKLATRLCKITHFHQPLALDVLAAAYGETGRYDEAVSTAEKAYKMALMQGPESLAQGLERRLKLYQNNMPYHQTPFGKKVG